jgi:hypothetical protein
VSNNHSTRLNKAALANGCSNIQGHLGRVISADVQERIEVDLECQKCKEPKGARKVRKQGELLKYESLTERWRREGCDSVRLKTWSEHLFNQSQTRDLRLYPVCLRGSEASHCESTQSFKEGLKGKGRDPRKGVIKTPI